MRPGVSRVNRERWRPTGPSLRPSILNSIPSAQLEQAIPQPSPSIPNRLSSLYPAPTEWTASSLSHLKERGKGVRPALPAPAKPLLPVQGNLDLMTGVGRTGESGG